MLRYLSFLAFSCFFIVSNSEQGLASSGSKKPDYQKEIVETNPDEQGRLYGSHHPTFGAFEDNYFESVAKLNHEDGPNYIVELAAAFARISHKTLKNVTNPNIHVIVNDLVLANLRPIMGVRKALLEGSAANKQKADRLHILQGDCLNLFKMPVFTSICPESQAKKKVRLFFVANLIHFLKPLRTLNLLADISEHMHDDGRAHIIAQTSYYEIEPILREQAKLLTAQLLNCIPDEHYRKNMATDSALNRTVLEFMHSAVLDFYRNEKVKYKILGKGLTPDIKGLTVSEFMVFIDPPLMAELAEAVGLEVESFTEFNYNTIGNVTVVPAQKGKGTFAGYVLRKNKNAHTDFRDSEAFLRVAKEAAAAFTTIDNLYKKNGTLYRKFVHLRHYPFISMEDVQEKKSS